MLRILLFCALIITSTAQSAINRFLLITGCARSGTTYTTKVLKRFLDLGHEKLGEDGMVAWQGAFDHKYGAHHWHLPDARIRFKHIFHQIRDPIPSITSMYQRSHDPGRAWLNAWDYILFCVPEIDPDDSTVVKCAKYWYYWNLAAEKRAEWTYRIEDFEKILPKMSKRLGVKIDKRVLNKIPRNVNHTPPTSKFKATWAILQKELDAELFENIKRMAKRYGYSTED